MRVCLAAMMTVSLAAGCGEAYSPWTSADYLTAAERTARFAEAMKIPPPAPMLDAQFYEWAMGTPTRIALGPTDYESFARITIDPKDYPAWRAKLVPLRERPELLSGLLPNWWMSPADAEGAEFFEPRPLSHRAHGFVMVTADRRTIFLYDFTV